MYNFSNTIPLVKNWQIKDNTQKTRLIDTSEIKFKEDRYVLE